MNISEEKWFCQSCGQVNDLNDSFCIGCGMERNIDAYGKQNTSKGEMLRNDKLKQKNKNLRITFIIVFCTFVGTVAILCFCTPYLAVNILFTVKACVLPAAIGIGFNFLGNAFRSSNGIRRFLHISGGIFQCICPPIMMLLCVFLFYDFSRDIVSIFAFTISFLGYIPAHYNPSYSLMKNNILGMINLFSTVFMWSFIMPLIGINDALSYARAIHNMTITCEEFVALLLKVGVIFIFLQTLKLLVNEYNDISMSKKES